MVTGCARSARILSACLPAGMGTKAVIAASRWVLPPAHLAPAIGTALLAARETVVKAAGRSRSAAAAAAGGGWRLARPDLQDRSGGHPPAARNRDAGPWRSRSCRHSR